MARDVCGLLDELEIAHAHMLGYSMGGAIAQEFVRQFPDRVSSLILCATMAGGPRAMYAKSLRRRRSARPGWPLARTGCAAQAGGINIGPAMTFGYIVGLHAAGQTPNGEGR